MPRGSLSGLRNSNFNHRERLLARHFRTKTIRLFYTGLIGFMKKRPR